MTIDNDEDLDRLRAIGAVVRDTLAAMIDKARPGMTTAELDALGAALLKEAGALSAPQVMYDFPGATCISINPAVAHGIPDETVMREGDLINIDVSAQKDGLFADTGASFVLGQGKPAHHDLVRHTRQVRDLAVRQARTGTALNTIGKTIESSAKRRGYKIIRNLTSHGIGRSLHEEPREIPSYYDKRDTRKLAKGAVITLEPFLSIRSDFADQSDDGWTLFTAEPDSATAQFEHTLVVTDRGPIVVT